MKTKPLERIFLIGYRGTGKTTVARLLAQRLDWAWIDADELLQRRQGKTIRAVFETDGEAAFRAMEAVLLAELCGRPRQVIATGGGVVLNEENRRLMTASGLVVWLKADARTIFDRLQADAATEQRPPLTGLDPMQEIQNLLAVREPLYQACADLTVDAGQGSSEDVVERIRNLLDEWLS